MIHYLHATLDATTGLAPNLVASRNLEAELVATSGLVSSRLIRRATFEHCIRPDFVELVIDGKEPERC